MYQFLAQVKSEFHYFSMILSFLAKVKRSYGDLHVTPKAVTESSGNKTDHCLRGKQ